MSDYTIKYARLTKEQFDELQQEFINFLATQSISAEEWKDIKKNKPEAAEEELDIFSDLIWEGVLEKVQYLENISANQMHLFYLTPHEMKLIAIKVHMPGIDLATANGFAWFKQNYLTDKVEIMKATKGYDAEKKVERFKLIEKGAVITKGELYRWFEEMIEAKQ
jgi:hypothetical protein